MSSEFAGDSRIARLWRHVPTRYLGPAIAIVVTAIAFWMLHVMTGQLHISDLKRAFYEIPAPAILWSFAATMLSYCALATYDIMATHVAAPGRVKWVVASVSGMAGFAFSNFLGFHLLTGGAIRYRIYARLGLDGTEIAKIILLTWSGLWLAITGLIASAVMISPYGIPFIHLINPTVDRIGGALTLIALAALFVYAGRQGRDFRLWGWRLTLPGRGPLFLQLIAGLIDIAGATYALYALLPPDLLPGFAAFLVIYLSAVLIAVVSHVPGGVGIFEVTMMAALGAGGRADVLAALLAYRIIYYVTPFSVAAVLLAITEAGWLKQRLGGNFGAASRFMRPLVPPVAAVIVFLAGLVLLFSGSIPNPPIQLAEVRGWLPLPLLESSHFLGSLAGLGLLVLASGLRRRLYTAWVAAMATLAVAVFLTIFKGLDWDETFVMVACLVLLFIFRGAFYRRRPERLLVLSPRWMALLAVTVAAVIWLGFFSYRHVTFSQELWWQFTWKGEAPRFLRASVGIVVATFFVGLMSLIHRPVARTVSVATGMSDAVKDLILHSPDSQTNIAWLGDKTFLVTEDSSAFLMYRRSGQSLISMGDPVGDPQSFEELVWQLREIADRQALRAVFYAVKPRNLPLYLDMGFAILKIGEVARVPLATFTIDGAAHQEHRYAVRRLEREGIAFDVVPAADFDSILPELSGVSNRWLQTKKGQEKGFALGHFDPAYLRRFDTAILRKEGRIVAFANLWRTAGHEEISADLMRFDANVSKVLMDGLFVHMMLYGRSQGYAYFNLGAAPLAGLADHPLASTWARLGTYIFRHGENFYHFEGLRAFKQKFDPVWTPQYLACPRGLAIPQVLLDVNRLISGPPTALLAAASSPSATRQRESEPIR